MWSLKEIKTKGDLYRAGYLYFYDIYSPDNLIYLVPQFKQICPEFVCYPFSEYGDCRLGYTFIIQRSIPGYGRVNASYFLYISNKIFNKLSILVELHRCKKNMKEQPPPEGSTLFWTTIEIYFPSGKPIFKAIWTYSIDENHNCYYINLVKLFFDVN